MQAIVVGTSEYAVKENGSAGRAEAAEKDSERVDDGVADSEQVPIGGTEENDRGRGLPPWLLADVKTASLIPPLSTLSNMGQRSSASVPNRDSRMDRHSMTMLLVASAGLSSTGTAIVPQCALV